MYESGFQGNSRYRGGYDVFGHSADARSRRREWSLFFGISRSVTIEKEIEKTSTVLNNTPKNNSYSKRKIDQKLRIGFVPWWII